MQSNKPLFKILCMHSMTDVSVSPLNFLRGDTLTSVMWHYFYWITTIRGVSRNILKWAEMCLEGILKVSV